MRWFCSLLGLVLLLTSSQLRGQTVTKNFATPEPVTGLIQASDGNYYAVSSTSIYRITPVGVATKIFTFGDSSADGAIPQPVVQGPDGALYGVTQKGGPNPCNTGTNTYQLQNCGVFYKINLDGSAFTVLHNFNSDEVGTGLLTGALVLADDGNFYGTGKGGEPNNSYNLGAVFRVSPSGSASLVHAFTVDEDDAPIGAMIQSTDGFLYGITQRNRNAGSYPITVEKDNGRIFKLTLSGQLATAFTVPADFSLGFQLLNTPVEGPDGTLYGGIGNGPSPNYYGLIYAAPPRGALQAFYTFGVSNISADLAFAGDGNMYGGAFHGADGTPTCTAENYLCGNEFELTTGGAFTLLHSFDLGANGLGPTSNVLAASNGDVLGTVRIGGTSAPGLVFDMVTALPAPVQLAFTAAGSLATTVPGGSQLTLNWKVLNAFSLSMQQCFAYPPPVKDATSTWTGKQTGTYSGGVFSGSTTITAPAATGSYIYALECGGVESGQVTLTVGNAVQITTTALPNGTVSKDYNAVVQANGGVLPYMWGYSGVFPKGLQIDSASGFFSGKPTQFGSYQVTIGAQDSSNPALMTTRTFPLTIASGLSLLGSLNNGKVGTAYNQTATVTGGLGPYKWALSSGKLPDGLSLNAANGAVTGTPAAAGKFTFSITVSDAEGMPATFTQSYTISTVVPPLTIVEGNFPNCTVNELCEGQFTATGGKPPYSWTIAPGHTFPAGLTLDPDGSFTGKVSQYSVSGPYELAVQVTDSEDPSAKDADFNGLSVVSGLMIVSIPLPPATIGLKYQAPAPQATGGVPPYTWKIIPSNPQLTEEYGASPATGALYSIGTPITTGTFSLGYTVSDSEGTPAQADMSATLLVNEPVITSATTLSTSNTTAGTGMNVTLTAKVASTGAAATGVVTFYNGSTSLGTAMLDTTQTATLSTSFSATGVYQLTAAYAGGGVVTGSVSSAITETVVAPAVSTTFNPDTLTVTSGQSGALTITLTPTGGYTGSVTFSCGQLPALVSCTFAPPSVTIAAGTGPVTDTLTIKTTANTVAAVSKPGSGASIGILAALTFWLPSSVLALFGMRRKPFRLPRLLAICLLAASFSGTVVLTGCGSPATEAKPGKYSIPIMLTLAGGSTQVTTTTVIIR